MAFRSWRPLFIVVALAAIAPLSAHRGLCQTVGSSLVEEARQAYQDLNYALAETKARAALSEYEAFTSEEISEVHTILAFITYSRNDQEAARRHFQGALRLNPGLALDPLLVSPKILAFFEETKQGMPADTLMGGMQPRAFELRSDPRTAAALRSLILPGWGQMYKHESTKGWLLGGLWGTTTAGAIVTHVLKVSVETDAGLAGDSLRAVRREHMWATIRNSLIISAAGIWLFSYVDALMTGNEPSGSVLRSETGGPTIVPEVNGSSVGIRASIRL